MFFFFFFFSRELNLINIHLFHDPSNIEALNRVI